MKNEAANISAENQVKSLSDNHSLKLNYNEEELEYFNFIKEKVQNGAYFNEALDWYIFRYLSPLTQRMALIIAAIFALFSLYFLIHIINQAFPLVQKVPVVIRSSDQSLYTPFIKPLRNDKERAALTVDESVAKYLLWDYIITREGHDYRNFQVEDVNTKFTRIKNTSSFNEYRNFQAFMSKDNIESPINDFGQNVYRTCEIESIIFIKPKAKDYFEGIRNFLSNKVPSDAQARFTVVTHRIDEDGQENLTRQNYLAKITFDYNGIDRDAKSGVINFSVKNYKLFKIK